MRDIAIYGAGGLGREVACLINRINQAKQNTWNLLGFFDDGIEKGQEINHFGKCLGGIEDLNSWEGSLNIVLCFGSPSTLKKVKERITKTDIDFPNIIDIDFFVADPDTFSIGKGNIIQRNCSLSTNITIGNFNLLNGWIKMGHDVLVGDFNVFMPCDIISGEVKIGNGNLFGASSFIKQQLKVGNNITLSPLSALLTKPKDNSLYIGNPSKLVKF